MDAANNPVKRQYNRKEVHTSDMPMSQKEDISMEFDKPLSHGEPLVHKASENVKSQYLEQLAFMEEPVTIMISENSRSDFPETHVSCHVNGKGAEVLMDGKWVEFGWLPIGPQLVVKRKYVEVLARSRSDAISTKVEGEDSEHPRNMTSRKTRENYPLSIIYDANPRGLQWLAAVRFNHA